MWSKVYWEMIEPVIKIRTLRARLASTFLYLFLGQFSLLGIEEDFKHQAGRTEAALSAFSINICI